MYRAQRQSQVRKQWREHCQGYGASQGTVHQGDDLVLFAIAHIYNCKVTVHKRVNSFDIAHPSTASKTLNLVLFDVQSDIRSENWSHFCSTRPIEPTERAGLDEPRGVGLESTRHGLAHPTPEAGEDAPARAQGRATLRVKLRVKRRTGWVVQWTPASSGPTGRPTHCCPRSGQRPPMRRRRSGGHLRPSNRPRRRSPPAPLHTAHAAPADSR